MLKRYKVLLTVLAITALSLSGCDTQAERANYNITKEAEYFNVYRRVVVINCIKGDVIFTMEGLMNINADREDNQLEIIVQTDKDKFQKHFIGLSDNVTYTIEDISGSQVSPYHYELNFNPNMWIPYSVKEID